MLRRPFFLLILGFVTALTVPAGVASMGAKESPKRKQTVVFRSGFSQDFEAEMRRTRQALFKTNPSTADGRLDLSPRNSGSPRLVMPPTRKAPTASSFWDGGAMRELSLQPTSFTPYDRYMGSVRQVLGSLDRKPADMARACALMRQGRSFRYTVTDPYRADSPAVTSAKRAGDCKSKSLWLYDRLGDASALYVIGKLDRKSKTSHAWVYWRNQGRWWILDPTDSFSPIAADSVSKGRYVPYYSYGTRGVYRHAATSLMIASAQGKTRTPEVASKSVQAAPQKNLKGKTGKSTKRR